MPSAIEELFGQGTLVRPSHEHPNLIHLIRAVATLAGVRDLDDAPATRQMIELIGRPEHLIFVLLDGLGMNIVCRLPENSFIKRNLAQPIHATCPSTTACALTAVTTAQYPNRHGVAGWFTYVPELGRTIAMLPFADRMSSEPLAPLGLSVEQVVRAPSICPRMKLHPLTVVPALIANTPYNLYSRGGTPGQGYFSIAHAMDRAIAHVTSSIGPTYTHVYLPEIDTLCHKCGVDDERVLPLVMQIDAELSRLADALAGRRTRIVVGADHGLINVPHENQSILFQGDDLLELLLVPPSGDARLPIFHVKTDRRRQFLDMFQARFADRMLLVETDEIERMELFGPGPMAPHARQRFGDFIGIAFTRSTISFHPPSKPLGHLYLAVHAGFSPDEMWVPLVVA
jgi:hypothetical protein